ncbi:hypothetical protein ACHAW6_006649 [Cyclotella cf. meneghiniana]
MDRPATLLEASTDSVDSNSSFNEEQNTKEVKSGRAINFSEKLHLVLSNNQCRDVIAWLPSGRSFCITNKEKFVQVVLPKFFKSKANFNSFERRLKTWGFNKIDASKKVFVFSHDSFRRDAPAEEELKEENHGFNLRKQLRIVLSDVGCRSFMWWLPSGESFCVASSSDLASEILFRHFGETRFKSFVSTLKREGFQRVKTQEVLGEAVYSHEFFQMGRPDLCRLMGRGGTVDLDGTEAPTACVSGNGGLAETTVLHPAFSQDSNNLSYPAAAAASLPTRGFLNPVLNAPRSNINMNFPIPMNAGFAPSFTGPQAIPTRVPQQRLTADKPFSNEVLHSMILSPFNGMRHPQAMCHMQRLNAEPNLLFSQTVPRSLNPTEQFLLNQNRNLQFHAGPPSMFPQTQIHFPSQQQQQVTLSMNPSFDDSQTPLKGIPMLSCHNSLLAANRKLQQHLIEHKKAETASSMAMLHRRDAATYQTNMSILEIEEELLKVKEMKLLMMKRKFQEQVEMT